MNAWFALLRPHQWLKNLMLLFPPFLGGVMMKGDSSFSFFILPVFAFCLASSSVYVLNDVLDVAQDRRHPLKRHRPVASGRLSARAASVIAGVLAFCAIMLSSTISGRFVLYLLAYLAISTAYSCCLKKIPLAELFCVVSGFLIRLMAGGDAFEVPISDWLFLSVFLLALFLISGKRLSELRHEGGAAPEQIREVLALYPKGFLEGCMLLSGAAVLVTYTMYVISHQGSIWLVPISCFGLLAYWRRVLAGEGGDPTRALLKDPALFLVGLVWLLLVGWGLYASDFSF